MELSQARALAIELMEKHQLIDQGWRFGFNNRKINGGYCRFVSKQITLNKIFTLSSGEKEVTDTILHEIAHALCGPKHGHDMVWKRKALEIGCSGNRCFDLNDDHKQVLLSVAPYKAICSNGHEHFAFRRPKRTRSCGLCSQRYDPHNTLEYKKVT